MQPSSVWNQTDNSPKRFKGVLKALYADRGYGFIACAETYLCYQMDVFAHHSQIKGVTVGHVITFAVTFNSKGQPQAQDVRLFGADEPRFPSYSAQILPNIGDSQENAPTCQGVAREDASTKCDSDVSEAEETVLLQNSYAHNSMGVLHQ